MDDTTDRDEPPFAKPRKWLEANGWWLNTLGIVLILFVVLNTSGLRNYDTIALTLTTLEIILVAGAFAGFWLIRRDAISQARETAERVAKETVNELENKGRLKSTASATAAQTERLPAPSNSDTDEEEGL